MTPADRQSPVANRRIRLDQCAESCATQRCDAPGLILGRHSRCTPTADVSLVADGQLYLPSVRRLPSGGRDAARHLQRQLAARGEPALEDTAAQALLEACCSAEDWDGDQVLGRGRSPRFALRDRCFIVVCAHAQLPSPCTRDGFLLKRWRCAKSHCL